MGLPRPVRALWPSDDGETVLAASGKTLWRVGPNGATQLKRFAQDVVNVREHGGVMVVITLAGIQCSPDRGKSFKAATTFASKLSEFTTRGLAYGNGYWIAAVPGTFSDRLWGSRDGRQWEQVAAGPETEHVYPMFQTPEGVSSIAHVAGAFLVVGGIAATGTQPVFGVFRVTVGNGAQSVTA